MDTASVYAPRVAAGTAAAPPPFSRRPSKTSRWVWPRLPSNYFFCPGSGNVWDLCVPSKSGVSISHSPLVLLKASNYWACTLEPASHNYWSPCAATTEACPPRAHAPQQREATSMRSRCTATKSSPRSPQLEKSPCSNEDPIQPKYK